MRRDNGSRIEFADSKTHAAKATRQVEKLARLSRRVQRVYFYHWVAPAPDATWDSALIDRRGRPRPSYKVVEDLHPPHPRGEPPPGLAAGQEVEVRALALAAAALAVAVARLRQHATRSGAGARPAARP